VVTNQKPREIAAHVLLRAQTEDAFIESLLDQALHGGGLSPVDRGLCQELVYGVVRWQKTLDWLIGQKASRGIRHDELKMVLRLGLYQLFWLGRIPDHAAVHESVELARKLGFSAQSGFVNGVLRSCVRERQEIERKLETLQAAQPAIGFSHPEWLVARWQRQFGESAAGELLLWNNTPAPVFVRINNLKTTSEKIAQQWANEGVKFIPKQWPWIESDLMVEFLSHPPLVTLPSFREGLFYVQDPSTLLAPNLLEAHSDESVLDVCAAPGGKTTYIAQQMQNRGRIIAEDTTRDRLNLIRENYTRLGLTCIDLALTQPVIDPKPAQQFDRILVDAPCSNTGVIRRRVELRWRIQPEEIERLSGIQSEILRRNAPRLKPGGTLVYSTCSLEPEENGAVVERFLREHAEYALETERALLPFKDGVDGAYVARLKRAR
jgi:16S rRNA (cytosine967-C5)-methyltransferase